MSSTPQTGKARLWRWAALASGSLVLLLLPTDAYGMTVPRWLMLLLCGFLVFCIVMIWRRDSAGRWMKALVAAAGGAVVVLVLYSCFFYPYWNSVTFRDAPASRPLGDVLSADEARADAAFAYNTLLRVHPALRGTVPEDFAQAADEAYSSLRAAGENPTVAQVGRAVEQMMSVLGDAHTGVGLRNLQTKYLPSSGVHARRGDRLTAVNGVEIADIAAEKASLLSYETPAWAELKLADYLVTDSGLAFLDIPSDSIEYTYVTPAGESVTEVAAADDFVDLATLHDLTDKEFPTDESSSAWVSYEIDEEHSLAVLTLDQCQNTADYLSCLHDMFTEVRERGIRNVAVDLRRNGGGDSGVATEFIKYLPVETYEGMGLKLRNGPLLFEYPTQTVVNNRYTDLTFDGSVYVLTSPATFSSAMLFTEYLTDNGLARQIGEAPGNIADGYGEVVTFQLPNSGLLFGVSTKQFERISGGGLLEPDTAADAEDALEVLKAQIAGSAAGVNQPPAAAAA